MHIQAGETYTLSQDVTELGSLTVEEGGTLAFASEAQRIVAGVVTVRGSVLGNPRVSITAFELRLQGTGSITADGVSTSMEGNAGGFYGASHGGRPYGSTAAVYGSVAQPTALGSRCLVNLGGGAILLTIASVVEVQSLARISANAVNSDGNRGGGSGGSVWIVCAVLSGGGTITADGSDVAIRYSGCWASLVPHFHRSRLCVSWSRVAGMATLAVVAVE